MPVAVEVAVEVVVKTEAVEVYVVEGDAVETGVAAAEEEQSISAPRPFAHSNVPLAIPAHTSVCEMVWPLSSYATTVGPGTLTTSVSAGERLSA